MQPQDLDARYELSFSYAAIGEVQKTEAEFNQAVAIDPDSNRVAEMRKRLSIGRNAR
jgi:Tfp pilus assembly protein PilF